MKGLGQDAVRALREHFPVLATGVYLNSNSTGAFPRGMERVFAEYWGLLRNWRDAHWEQLWPAYLAHADSLARFLGAPKGSVVTDVNMSALLGRLVSSIEYDAPKNRIVCTSLDFPTVPFLLRRLERIGAELVVVPMSPDGAFDEDALERAIDERTRLVCCSHASYSTGALLDAPRIARACRRNDALFVLDGYQSAGVVPVNVEELDVDAFAGGSHKWLCGSEVGYMYVRPSVAAHLEPLASGWVASRDPLAFGSELELAEGAQRFAAGTPVVLMSMISQPGLSIIADVGASTIRELSLRYTGAILDRALEERLPALTPREAERRAGVVCLRFPEVERVHERLMERGFVCSHRGGNLRIAPHVYNTEEEVASFLDALAVAAREVRA